MNKSIKIDPYGFREYDARWLYEKDINLAGIENLGKGLGTQIKIHTKKESPKIIVGHDYRSYSEEIKNTLKRGLMSTALLVFKKNNPPLNIRVDHDTNPLVKLEKIIKLTNKTKYKEWLKKLRTK